MTTRQRERRSLTCKQPYTGKLAAPIEVTGIRGADGELTIPDEGHKIVKAAKAERYKAVFELFGISRNDPERWRRLAEALFDNCVPGAEVILVEPSKRGAKRKYEGNFSEEQFSLRVEALVKQRFPREQALRRAGIEFGSKAGIRGLRNMASRGRTRWAILLGSISDFEDDEYLADLIDS